MARGESGGDGASALGGVRHIEVDGVRIAVLWPDGGAGGRGVVAVERSGGVPQQGADCGFDAGGCGQPYFAVDRSGGRIGVKGVREAGGEG